MPILRHLFEGPFLMAEPTLDMLQTLVQRVLGGQRRMDTRLDRIIDDLGDPKVRMTNAGEALAGVNRRAEREPRYRPCKRGP